MPVTPFNTSLMLSLIPHPFHFSTASFIVHRQVKATLGFSAALINWSSWRSLCSWPSCHHIRLYSQCQFPQDNGSTHKSPPHCNGSGWSGCRGALEYAVFHAHYSRTEAVSIFHTPASITLSTACMPWHTSFFPTRAWIYAVVHDVALRASAVQHAGQILQCRRPDKSWLNQL